MSLELFIWWNWQYFVLFRTFVCAPKFDQDFGISTNLLKIPYPYNHPNFYVVNPLTSGKSESHSHSKGNLD